MRALSIKQPYAFIVAIGVKDIENRTWFTKVRERVYIHAPFRSALPPYQIFNDEQANALLEMRTPIWGSYDETTRIIGEVTIADCVINHPSIWAEKTIDDKKPIYNWVLKDPIIYQRPILKVKGRLNFWKFDIDTHIHRMCPNCASPNTYKESVNEYTCRYCQGGLND